MLLWLAWAAGLLTACQRADERPAGAARRARVPVLELPLAGPPAATTAELSGLAWWGERLVLLPQYPERTCDQGDGCLWLVPRAQLLAALARAQEDARWQPAGVTAQAPAGPDTGEPSTGRVPGPALTPTPLVLRGAGPLRALPGFQGFEALAIDGQSAWLTVETQPDRLTMLGYLVAGQLDAPAGELRLGQARQQLPAQSARPNAADEALVVWRRRVYSFYEENAAASATGPEGARARVFDARDPALRPLGCLAMPDLPHRLTDASEADEHGRFWVLNYQFRGQVVERLLQLELGPERVALVEGGSFDLLLDPAGARNWEGLVGLGDGFLAVTDRFPRSILAWLPRPPRYAGEPPRSHRP